MKYCYPLFFKRLIVFTFLLLWGFVMNSQVGIGTNNPDMSSMLDVQSTSFGLLIPRMTKLQRVNIQNPANALLVYDEDEKSYFYYDSIPPNPRWVRISTEGDKRTKHVLVKSQADFPAPSGGVINLKPDYLYEINGPITLTASIKLNNAYIFGKDTNVDKLIKTTGNVFTGNTGGIIRNITVTGGGTAFNITGGTSLIVQNTIITGMGSVGKISGVGMYFGNIIQYISNKAGITYTNIPNLLLNNQGWLNSNEGTFETFTGSFNVVQKVSGFSIMKNNAVAMDFSSNPSVGMGVMHSVTFSGTTSSPSGYIKGYTVGSYPGYNFNNAWSVDCLGIPREADKEATGDINFPGTITGGAGYTTSFNGPGREKVWGDTFSNNLYRFTRDGNNKITYRGEKKRYFRVNASISYQLTNTDTKIKLYIAKNGIAVPHSIVYGSVSNTSSFSSASISETIELDTNDYIEVWAERIAGRGKMFTVSLNLSAR